MMPFFEDFLYFDIASKQQKRVLFLKQRQIFPFLCHKSATMCQRDSNEASNSKLKPDLCNCVKIETIVSTAPPQLTQKRDTIILGHTVNPWSQPFLRLHGMKQRFVNMLRTTEMILFKLLCRIEK